VIKKFSLKALYLPDRKRLIACQIIVFAIIALMSSER
jgi:hypothetical protein